MIPLLITPDLRQSCPSLIHHPGDSAALEPSWTKNTGEGVLAGYGCWCGETFTGLFDGDSPWPETTTTQGENR